VNAVDCCIIFILSNIRFDSRPTRT